MIKPCIHCDTLNHIPPLQKGQKAFCRNCNSLVNKHVSLREQKIIALSFAALVMLVASLINPFISISSQNITQTISLLDAAVILFDFQHPLLAILLDLSIVGLPFVFLCLLIIIHSPLFHLFNDILAKKLLWATFSIQVWIMCEIFLIGIAVSLVKIIALAQVDMGPSFWAFTFFVIFLMYCQSLIDKQGLWQQVNPDSETIGHYEGERAIEAGLKYCNSCEELTDHDHCPVCDKPLHFRAPLALQKTWAWLITTMVLYIPANLFPILNTESLGQSEPATIIGGVVLLWQTGSYPIATVIFLASVVVPFGKMMLLAWLSYLAAGGITDRLKLPGTRIYQVVEIIGKWSMIDVFVVIILVSLVQFGGLMSITPGTGAVFFTAMVICSMLASHSFDPRLLWDSPSQAQCSIHKTHS